MLSRLRPAGLLLALSGSALLGACASTGGDGSRSRLLAPKELGVVYSEIELQTSLALATDSTCAEKACDAAQAFRRRVSTLGLRLARAARDVKLQSGGQAPYFYFTVPMKSEYGTLSSTGGSIVVFEGVRELDLADAALAFLIAREMGHVLAEHHEENSATSMIVSVAATVLLPVANLLRGAAATVSTATTAAASSSVAATAATTAASVAGSRALKSLYRPEQAREADLLALGIMAKAGWTPLEVSDALLAAAARLTRDDGWTQELLESWRRVDRIAMGPPTPAPVAPTAATARTAAVARAEAGGSTE
jgi:Zn-dependent protease with chaperone function